MSGDVAVIVRKELETVIRKLRKKAADLEDKSIEAISGPKGGILNWTQKQRDAYFATTSEQRCAKSNKLMDEQLDHEFAAREFEHLLFSHNLRTKE